jgi:hypothetical protein
LTKQIVSLKTLYQKDEETKFEHEQIKTKYSIRESLLGRKSIPLVDPNVIFATDKKIPAKSYIKGHPVSMISTNIPSCMGGRENLWESSGNNIGLKDPYGKSYSKKTKPLF